jgi:hypothetical protein
MAKNTRPERRRLEREAKRRDVSRQARLCLIKKVGLFIGCVITIFATVNSVIELWNACLYASMIVNLSAGALVSFVLWVSAEEVTWN